MDSPSSLALIGIVGTVVAGLFKLVTDTIKANTKAIEKMADSSQKIADATEKGNREAKERNGHLGEQNVQITELIVGQTTVLNDIQASSKATADTTARVEKVLVQSAHTLTQTESDKSEAAESVKETLAHK